MGIMTISGSSVKKSETFQIHYKHIITPKTYEVVDEFVVTNKYKNEDNQALLRNEWCFLGLNGSYYSVSNKIALSLLVYLTF